MEPSLRLATFRAYEETRREQRIEQFYRLLRDWLQHKRCCVTYGIPEPCSHPANKVPLDAALPLVDERLTAHEPIHIWSYPVVFRLQLWRSGWDLRTQAAIWEGTGNLRYVDQREQIFSLLWDLIEKHAPLFLIGPVRRHRLPTYITQALHEFERWKMFYVGGSLYKRFNWRATLQNRAKLQDLNDGLWVEKMAREGVYA